MRKQMFRILRRILELRIALGGCLLAQNEVRLSVKLAPSQRRKVDDQRHQVDQPR